jgi:hypothetical protein
MLTEWTAIHELISRGNSSPRSAYYRRLADLQRRFIRLVVGYAGVRIGSIGWRGMRCKVARYG